jgi:hypothetical protein
MTISDTRKKCKNLLAQAPRDVLIIFILILASLASFGLGYLAGLERGGQGSRESSLVVPPSGGEILASKNGTKYYLPECAGADKISEANKVWFVSTSAARAAGYTPAANCEGL